MSDFLAGAGVLVAAGAAAAAILLPAGRPRSAAMVLAMLLFPVLIVGDQWHTAQIVDLRHDEWRIAALVAIAIAVIAVLACVFRRWPIVLPLAVIFALPFRVPLEAGGDTANLLVPLYLVIAGGVAAAVVGGWGASGGWRGGRTPARSQFVEHGGPPPVTGPAGRLPIVLAAVVLLYTFQTLYSEDFSKGLQNVCFFLVPFTVAFGLLRDVVWDRRLLRLVLIVVGVEAGVFVLVGSVEFLTRSLYWNDQIIRSNEFHTYFRVNGVFWDPNIYGRYLALVTTIAAAALLWVRTREPFWLLSGLILILWIGLVPTYSQSSFFALLAGLAILAAIRWSRKWTLLAAAVGLVGAILVVLLAGGSGKITSDRLNIDLSGRGSLISGGLDLFAERPLWGYGSGGFQSAYAEHRENKDAPVTISHTEPVTVAAEQGLIGLVAYLLLILVALRTLAAGIWGSSGGWRGGRTPARSQFAEHGGPPPVTGPAGRSTPASPAARAAVLAAFVALLVHTLAYAGFFEDPITWVLLAAGASLAAAPAVRDPA